MSLENTKLNILFLCGSLEPYKDGVGDYTLKLASELQQLGHVCTCISLFDKHLSPIPPLTPSFSRVGKVTICRISSSSTWLKKILFLKSYLKSLSPDIISLQYVPYSYSYSGIPIRLLFWLPLLASNYPWHIMYHEIWIEPTFSLKNKSIALLQKIVLFCLHYRLNPQVANTSNSVYRYKLSAIGLQSTVLPLFSHIDFTRFDNQCCRDEAVWNFLFFGSIHDDWNHSYLFTMIELARDAHNIKSCNFNLIGNAGEYGNKLWKSLSENSSSYFNFNYFGQLPEIDISHHLQTADFGITTTPSHLIEKSSSVAAMLSHGLPVIIPRLSPDLNCNLKLKGNPKFLLLDNDFVDSIAVTKHFPQANSVQISAKAFIDSLPE